MYIYIYIYIYIHPYVQRTAIELDKGRHRLHRCLDEWVPSLPLANNYMLHVYVHF